mmetsp:Transcript_30807/g.60264  ORF Transcript_30807/g.60264 Transcript_30807/m.60264 type:complete len:176 (-) Transcript_30807:198-725(-)
MVKAAMTTPQAYFDTLAAITAVLVLKATIVNILIVRAALSSGIQRHPEDKKFALRGFFSALMFTFGPGANNEFWTRCTNNLRNILENEVFFCIIAYAYGAVTVASPMATVLIKVFLVMRLLHLFFHVFLPAQPFRAVFWMVGAIITVTLAVQIVMLKGSLLVLGSKDLAVLKGEL